MQQSLLDLARHIKQTYSQKHLHTVVLSVGVFLYGALYTGSLLHQRSVDFTYSKSKSCISRFTIFPEQQQQTDSSGVKAVYDEVVKVGPIDMASTRLCFVPEEPLESGEVATEIALFGSPALRTAYAIDVPEAPSPSLNVLESPIGTQKELVIPLSSPDNVHSYYLQVKNKKAECANEANAIRCDISALRLKQSSTYNLELHRKLGSVDEIIASQQIKTLSAVVVKKSSIRDQQIVYSKKRSFSLTTNKALVSADAELLDAKGKAVQSSVAFKQKTVTVTANNDLDRESAYTLVLKQAEATDGSTMETSKKVRFTVSGGPTVVSVNIGTYDVSSSALVTLQFDQAIAPSVDVSKYVTFNGGQATITRGSSTVSLQLQGLGRCQSFSIAVKPGILSSYGIAATNAWNYGSRTTCHSVSSYGTSVQGRSLLAYYFGSSGPITMYVGAIHGNESSSTGLMHSWISHLEANPGLFSSRRIVVVPTINPDGLAAGTRTNSRGVNLNRNFPTDNWVKDIDDTDGVHKGGGGKSPLSEPEAKALASLTTNLSPRLLLSFHAIGSLVVGDAGSSSASYAAAYASRVGYRNATGQSSTTFDYAITGAYEDWTYRNIGIPSMVIELGSYSYYNFAQHRSALEVVLR